MSVCRYEPQSYWWTDSLLALFVIHRFGERIVIILIMKTYKMFIVSALYYYYYKRAGLSIADPRYYEDLSWVKEENFTR